MRMDLVGNSLIVGCAMVLVVSILFGACAEGEVQPPEIGGEQNQSPGDNVDLPNDENGSLDPCENDEDCPGDEECFEGIDGEGQCRLPGGDNGDDNGGEGDACTESSDCDGGLCVDGVCVSECEDDSDCPQGYDCGGDGVCEPPACSSDDDCNAGQGCAVVVNQEDELLETVCLIDDDRVVPGGNCSVHDDCRGRYCIEGTCSSPCENESTCGSNQICGETSISKDGVDGELSMCLPVEVELCESPQDCTADDMTCNMPTYGMDGEIDGGSCGYTNPGEAAVGDSCTSSAECESNLCRVSDDGTTGECFVFCEESGRDCADTQECVAGGDNFGICAGSCTRNADCDGGNICTLGADRQNDLVKVCEPPPEDASSTTGEPCGVDNDCDTGLCLTSVMESEIECVGDSQCPDDLVCGCPPTNPNCSQHICYQAQDQCTELCDPANGDADCQGGGHDMTRCAEDVAVDTEAGTELVSMCAPE